MFSRVQNRVNRGRVWVNTCLVGFRIGLIEVGVWVNTCLVGFRIELIEVGYELTHV